MGQSQSKARPEDFEFPPPIQTRDELLQRLTRHQINDFDGLSLGQQVRLSQVFDTFCTQTESTKYFSEANLASCLQCAFPSIPELKPILMDAISIMHRFLLRLGSYPYQNDPEEFLTHDVLHVAVIRAYHLVDEIGCPFESSSQSVLYQSMARLDREKTRKRERSKDDDDDLEFVLRKLANWRRHPDNPKGMIRGPSHPPASHFPSSWSTDCEQAIPAREFRPFLRLMLVLNQCHSNIDVENFAMVLTEVERATDCILSAFLRPGASVDDDITFDIFRPAIWHSAPHLLRGWPRLLDPLISHKPPTPGLIFNLPVLSQIGFILPEWLCNRSISVVWSAKADGFHDWARLSTIAVRLNCMILLVSGYNSRDEHVKFGLFKFQERSDTGFDRTAISFQLEPVHQGHSAWTTSGDCSIQAEPAEGGKTVLVCRLAVDKEKKVTDLVIDAEGHGRFTFQGPDGCVNVDESLRVDAVELLLCG